MSICNPCTPVVSLPVCTQQIIIGTIAQISTAVYVYLRNVTLDKTTRIAGVTSDGAGLVTINTTTTKQLFNVGHSYELWITLQNSTNIEEKINFTIGSTSQDCVALRFTPVLDEDLDNLSAATQTLALQ